MSADDIDPAQVGVSDGVEAAGSGLMAGSAPVAAASPPHKQRRRVSRRAKFASVAVVVVLALAAGVFVWSPWQPNPPSRVSATSPTATSVLISWKPSGGGKVSPSGYRVLRDGRQVGAVPANVTSWTDHGLAPGTTYQYAVVAAGLEQSAPSATATVRTLAPGPVHLTARATRTTVALHWSPSPLGPAPEHYVVSYGIETIATLPGTATSYTDTNQFPDTSFRYTVTAEWGSHRSVPTAVTGMTMAAPLDGLVAVSVDPTSVPGASWTDDFSLDQSWDDRWIATSSCSGSVCGAMTVQLSFGPSDSSESNQFPVTVKQSGAGYSGSTTAQETECGSSASDSVMETDTVTLSLTPSKVQNGAWTDWTGIMTLSAPPASVAGGTCSPAFWSFAVTSALLFRHPPSVASWPARFPDISRPVPLGSLQKLSKITA